jgi:tetratricopeptide (TPR) repeat protein
LAALLSAAAAGQGPASPPGPCPPNNSQDASPASDRDALLASDLNAASRDEGRAAELLAKAAEGSRPLLWPTDWLVLARRDESRGDFPSAAARYRRYVASLEGSGEDTRWVEPRVKVLELAARTGTGASSSADLPVSVAEPEARLALADGRAALARGDRNAAREKLGYAMRLDPRYADAAVAAAALDAQAGRTADAIREYRLALAADPERDEAAVPLANLLWEHPDRASKAESLLLLDRAAAARPDLPSLRRRSAERWAEWGDPGAALQRLDAWRSNASDAERRQTDALRGELASRASSSSSSSSTSSSAPPAVSPRPRLDLPPTRSAAGPESGTAVWIWGISLGVLVAAAAFVLARRRRLPADAASEPDSESSPAPPQPAPVPPITKVSLEDLVRFLRGAAEERQLPPPPLSSRGFPEEGQTEWFVRVPPPDWEKLWRTIFGATLSAVPAPGPSGARTGPAASPRLAISGSLVRDQDSHAAPMRVRFALADSVPGALTTEAIRGRSAGRDWAAVEELVRAYRGSLAVAPSIDRQFVRRLLIELPVAPGAIGPV